MARQHPTPFGVDADQPSTARIYDYLLGGTENYRVDRDAAVQIMHTVPDSVVGVRNNRAFLIRAVRYLAVEAGITQFIDIGSGLPTQLNVHEVALACNPDAHVVYVDYDPAVRAYGDVLLATAGSVQFAEQDLREPELIFDDPSLRGLIDMSKPVALLLISILPFIYDTEDPEGILGRLRNMLAPGSYLVITHILDDPRSRAIAAIQRSANTRPWTPRSRDRIRGFFGDFDLVDPGLLDASAWQPDPAQGERVPMEWNLGGMGRKP